MSEFRANMFEYVDWMNKKGGKILLKNKNEIVAQMGPKKTKKETKDKIDLFLEDIDKLHRDHPFKAGKSLSLSVDKILYGKK